jgi:regulator of protease activity HflC (stomatin/prohibitin superfamily)
MPKIKNDSTSSKYFVWNLTPAGRALAAFCVIVAFILLFMIVSTVRVVSVGHVGIVTRFGRVVGEDQSGLHFILPWPVEQMTGMNVQIQLSQVPANAATLDLQQVSTTVALNYNLTAQTANQVYREVGTSYVSTIIDPIVQETFKAITAQYNATDLIQERSKVQAETLDALTKAFDAKGITVDNLNIVDFQFSPQYSAAIENKQVEAQNVQTAQYKLQQAQLNAQANQVQDAALSPQILEQQAISKWDGKMPQVVSGGTGNIFGINLTD